MINCAKVKKVLHQFSPLTVSLTGRKNYCFLFNLINLSKKERCSSSSPLRAKSNRIPETLALFYVGKKEGVCRNF
jgi:hypothetical protein